MKRADQPLTGSSVYVKTEDLDFGMIRSNWSWLLREQVFIWGRGANPQTDLVEQTHTIESIYLGKGRKSTARFS